MTPDREERLRRAGSTDPEVQDAYYREVMADARRVVAASQPHRKDRPMSFANWRTAVAVINAACIALYIALIWQIAHNTPAILIALALYLVAMPIAQWAVRRECETAELERLAILRKSKAEAADWKKLAEQLEQHISTTNPPAVPEFPEELK